ncbi:MAG: tetratricopeptide repeat protein, partial [Candidatus Poribacteria bacterium]|nr:tetratricopeptide repeat protein [Candidatus Poribacteria bacterium]
MNKQTIHSLTIHNLSEVIRLNPENITAYLNRGYVYWRQYYYHEAIADYDEAIRLDPENIIAYNNRGGVYRDIGDYDKVMEEDDYGYDIAEVIADCSESIRLDPENATAYIDRGYAYDLDRVIADHLKGMPAYSAYSTEDEEDETYDDYKDGFRKFVEEEEYNREILTCTDAIRLDPKNPTPYSNRGDVYFRGNDWNRAISDYNEAIRLAPGDVISYNRRGDAHYEKSNYDEAIKDYDVVIRLIPEDDSADIREKRGDAYYQKGNYDKAIEDYNEAIRINPGGAISAYVMRRNVYSEKLNIAPASDICDEAIKANLEVAGTYHNKGYTCYREGEYEKAIANYSEAIKLDPKNAKVYVDRGNAYSKKCDIDLDIADSAEVIRAKNDIDMAIIDYNEAIRRNLGNVIAYFNRGRAYIKKSNIELAAYNAIVTVDELNEVIRRNPKNAIAYFSRGYTYS